MSEYLKRENVLALAVPIPGCFSSMISSWDVVHMPAADVVEVVRCRDCVYFKPVIKNHNGVGNCRHSVGLVTENHYCSYGKRRDTNAAD